MRIKDKSQSEVINELKEEVLGYPLVPIKSESPGYGPFSDIITITNQEISDYRQSIRELIAAIKAPIFIKQGMLIATVLFDKSADVYEASRQILERVSPER